MARSLASLGLSSEAFADAERLASESVKFHVLSAVPRDGENGPQIAFTIRLDDGTREMLTLGVSEKREALMKAANALGAIGPLVLKRVKWAGKTLYLFEDAETPLADTPRQGTASAPAPVTAGRKPSPSEPVANDAPDNLPF